VQRQPRQRHQRDGDDHAQRGEQHRLLPAGHLHADAQPQADREERHEHGHLADGLDQRGIGLDADPHQVETARPQHESQRHVERRGADGQGLEQRARQRHQDQQRADHEVPGRCGHVRGPGGGVGATGSCQWKNSAIRMMTGIGTPRKSSRSERMGISFEVLDFFDLVGVAQRSRRRPP
jgi:hypothetical protein